MANGQKIQYGFHSVTGCPLPRTRWRNTGWHRWAAPMTLNSDCLEMDLHWAAMGVAKPRMVLFRRKGFYHWLNTVKTLDQIKLLLTLIAHPPVPLWLPFGKTLQFSAFPTLWQQPTIASRRCQQQIERKHGELGKWYREKDTTGSK